MALTILLAVGAALLGLLYLYSTFRLSYWARRGVPGPKPLPIVGNVAGLFTGKMSFTAYMQSLTTDYLDVGYCGIYMMSSPALAVWDPDMIKQVVTKDFSSFHDRNQPYDEVNDPLSATLFAMEGAKWRNLRNKLSPSFTSGKLKLMFVLMKEVADELSAAMHAERDAAGELDVSRLLSQYAIDVIGTCAFGVQIHSLRDKDNHFLEMAREVMGRSAGNLVRFALSMIHPRLSRLLPLKWLFARINHFFIKLMTDTVTYRDNNKVERVDFVHLMMQLRGGPVDEDHVDLTPGVMAAQASTFIFAGLDNVSNTVGYCINYMAKDQELQARVAKEVSDVLRSTDGELSYDALKRMELVTGVIHEGLRLWSPIGFLVRKCNATTQVGDVLVEKGTTVMVISDNMHRDPRYFPDPERFDPARHSGEARDNRHPYAYLPFGEGPRICIAERFAMLKMKLALAVLVRDFSFSKGPNYEEHPELDPMAAFPRPKHGFRVILTPRK